MNSKDTTQHSDDKIIRQTDEETPQDEKETGRQTDKSIRHIGGCHCGTVRYEFYAPKVLRCFRCNCSICTKKQHILHAPVNQFKLLQGEDSLTTYTFNTHQAKHMFCKVCYDIICISNFCSFLCTKISKLL